MDITMSLKDGIEATKEIKNKYPKACVVMLTAMRDEEIMEQAKSVNVNMFIQKPFNKYKIISASASLQHVKGEMIMGKDEIFFYSVEKVSDSLGLDTDLILQLSEMLLINTQSTNDLLKEAIMKMDYKNILLFAHDIKGSCANLLMEKISESALLIEKMAKQESVDYKLFLELCERIDEYISAYKKAIGKQCRCISSTINVAANVKQYNFIWYKVLVTEDNIANRFIVKDNIII